MFHSLAGEKVLSKKEKYDRMPGLAAAWTACWNRPLCKGRSFCQIHRNLVKVLSNGEK